MNFNIKKLTILFLCLVVSSVTYARGKSSQHSLVIKGGGLELDEKVQLVGTSTVYTFEVDSDSVFSIAYEKKNKRNGFAYGVEYLRYENKYSKATSSGVAEATLILFNVKKYFKVSKVFQPYIGIGAGVTFLILTDDASGNIAGGATFGSQFVVGMSFRVMKKLSLIVEYKQVNAEPEDVFGNSLNISGKGVYGALSIDF